MQRRSTRSTAHSRGRRASPSSSRSGGYRRDGFEDSDYFRSSDRAERAPRSFAMTDREDRPDYRDRPSSLDRYSEEPGDYGRYGQPRRSSYSDNEQWRPYEGETYYRGDREMDRDERRRLIASGAGEGVSGSYRDEDYDERRPRQYDEDMDQDRFERSYRSRRPRDRRY